MMLRVLLFSFCGAATEAASMANTTNTTNTHTTDSACPTEFAANIAKLFFDEQCVANMHNDTFECPVKTVNLFVEDFIDGLRFESGVVTFIGMIALSMLMQVGGIPTARGCMGTFLWGIYTTGLIMQWLAQLGSLIMITAAYMRVRDVFGPCMQPWKYGMNLLNVIALAVFPFMPIVLTKLSLMMITFAGITEAVKVYYGSKRIKTGKAYRLLFCRGVQIDEKRSSKEHREIDAAMLGNYLVLFVVLPCGFSALMWLLSMSWIFAIVFFVPIALACALLYLAILTVLRLGANCVMASESKRVAITTLRSMLWFAARTTTADEEVRFVDGTGIPGNVFTHTLLFAMTVLLLAPLINFGTWLAVYIYRGNSTDENIQALAEIYLFTFEVFRTAKFALPAWPAISIDPTQLGGLGMLALMYLTDLAAAASFDAAHFLEGARALLVLNFLLSLVKTGIAVVAAVLSAGAIFGVLPNIQFSDCATWDMAEDKFESKLDELVLVKKVNNYRVDVQPSGGDNWPRAARLSKASARAVKKGKKICLQVEFHEPGISEENQEQLAAVSGMLNKADPTMVSRAKDLAGMELTDAEYAKGLVRALPR